MPRFVCVVGNGIQYYTGPWWIV